MLRLNYIALLVFACFLFACQQTSPIEPQPQPSTPLSLKQTIHGTWHTDSDLAFAPYEVFDSSKGTQYEKVDEGYGIHRELAFPFEIDSSRIYRKEGNGSMRVRYWYKLTADTLLLSFDSLFSSFRCTYHRLSHDILVNNWVEQAVLDIGPPIWTWTDHTSWTRAVAYADSTWFVLSQNDSSDIYPFVLTEFRHPWGPFLGSFNANAHAIDAEPGYLWTCGRFWIAKYNLPDLQLVSSFDASVIQPSGRTTWILGMAVSDSLIYVSTLTWVALSPVGSIYIFTKSGQFLTMRTSCSLIEDMAWHDGRLWATTGSNFFYELDPVTCEGLHSYYVIVPPSYTDFYFGAYNGVSFYDNSLGFLNRGLGYWALTRVIVPSK